MKAWLSRIRLLFTALVFGWSLAAAPPGARPVGAKSGALPLQWHDGGIDKLSADTSHFGMTEGAADTIEARRLRAKMRVTDFDHREWARARPALITRYWSGAEAPPGRHAEARVVWDDEAISVRFVYRQAEPFVVNPAPRLERKTVGLWERDVCEVFIAPDAQRPERYFEFEAAPTGEWIDLAIVWRPTERETDWDYRSGMQAAARVEKDMVTIVLRAPWTAFGRAARAGDRWRVNFFRCAGKDPTRGYMAWRPTRTPEPNFHVPQAFGELKFKGQ